MTRLFALLVLTAVLGLQAGPARASDALMEDVRVLSADAMEGRGTGTPGADKARAHLVGRLAEIGVEPVGEVFEQAFTYQARGEERRGVNLVGRIKGRSAGPALLIMAHYDHLGIHEGQIHNGADDNASGVAVVLAIAEAFAAEPPEHEVIVALLDAEEVGLRGARALAADPPRPLDEIGLVMNLDMVARNDRNELYASGAAHYPGLRPWLERLQQTAEVDLRLGHDQPVEGEPYADWTDLSDHAAFHAKGVPFVYFGVEDHADYHKPTDDFAAIPEDFFRRSAATLVAAARLFDAELKALAKAAKAAP